MTRATLRPIGIVFTLLLALAGCTEPGDAFVDRQESPINDALEVGEDGTIDGPIDYATQVAPIFESYQCFLCHGATPIGGDLDMTGLPDTVPEGLNGPVLVPCDADNSLLVQKITCGMTCPAGVPGGPMPSASVSLTDTEVQIVRAWINGGATATADPANCP